jgi:hypothetical protein
MTKQVNVGDSVLFVINTVNSANGEVLYYTANNQPNSAFVTGNIGTVTVDGNVASANLTITENAIFSTDFTLQIRRNSIIGAILAESANVYLVPPPPPNTHGWFGGGNPGPFSTVDRIDFAADTGTASVRGPLSLARDSLAAAGNKDFGWFAGGEFAGTSLVDRITFADDTATASVRGPLSRSRYDVTGAVSNSEYGWFGGGRTTVPLGPLSSTVDRITFADDTATATARGPLSQARASISATGNDDFGWFGGGSPGPSFSSVVDRITFAADTSTASVRGPLSTITTNAGAVGNKDFGWFGGVGWPTTISTLDRITFASDTGTASVRGPLSVIRGSLAASGTDDYGWFGGGQAPGPFPGAISRVDRITFADDTATASVRGPLSSARYRLAATAGAI